MGKKSDEVFERDYSRYVAPNEPGLVLALNMSEGNGNYAYDRSYSGSSNFNKNHAFLFGTIQWSTTVPSPSQLSHAAYTNAAGIYSYCQNFCCQSTKHLEKILIDLKVVNVKYLLRILS